MNDWATGALVLVLAALGVSRLQPRLAETVHAVVEREDVYAIPPPRELHAATLGWDAAAVDLLWAKLQVDYGQHWSEHRDFRDVPRYLDAIFELEPTYAPAYRYLDTMLAYRPLHGTEQDVRLARAYLERGTRERPNDAAVWVHYGEFIALIAPSFLHDPGERAAWRRDGAAAMGHAVELGAEVNRAITAASLLTRGGQTRAAIHYLERAYAFTEDPSMSEAHERIGRELAALQASALRDAADTTARAVYGRWQREMPFAARELYLLLGPGVDTARCAGPSAATEPACARAWPAALKAGDSAADEGAGR